MAIVSISQLDFLVDLESEKSVSWPDGSKVYVSSTQQSYVLLGGSFINTTQISSMQGSVYAQSLGYTLT